MASPQRMKTLRLVSLLQEEADANHPLTTKELCDRLGKEGIGCDRRTLYRDIEGLIALGYPVQKQHVGHYLGYYLETKSFSLAELKVLMDAVQAANFITESQTEEMLGKIASLGGKREEEILSEHHVKFKTHKMTNNDILLNIGVLEKAIRTGKKCSFFYFDYDAKHRRVYRKNKWRYSVSPIALIYSDDNYYLMTYHSHLGTVVNYRIDRMERVQISEEDLSEEALAMVSKVTEFTDQAFLMFQGETSHVRLKFDPSLAGVIFDKFGKDVTISKDHDKLTVAVDLKVSPTFFGWVFQFGKGMEIVSPKEVREQYLELIQSLLEE